MKEIEEIKTKLVKDFTWYYENNYITPRDGNACLQISDDRYLITPSGVQKQNMSSMTLLEVDSNGELVSPSSLKPSIELQAHIVAIMLRKVPVSVHVHSMNTVSLFSLATKLGFLGLVEDNFRSQWPELFRYTKLGKTVPYLYPGSHELHESIKDSFQSSTSDIIVLDRHGVIAVGESLEECKEHIQRLEHVSEITLKMIMASNGDFNILK